MVDHVEYEAMFGDQPWLPLRQKLTALGAQLVRPEFLQRRCNFSLPGQDKIAGQWLRVRDEGNRVTLSWKADKPGGAMTDQQEICLVVDDFERAKQLLKKIGCQAMAYQETKREIWELDGVEICLDEWPFLEPFVEIEGRSAAEVKAVAEKLGLDWSEALFSSVTALYVRKYSITWEIISNQTPRIVFGGQNPFVNK